VFFLFFFLFVKLEFYVTVKCTFLQQICAFYLATDYSGACGPRGFGDDNDKPEIFIVRFQRNATYETLKAEKRNNLMEALQGQHNYASQLVARHKGPDEIQEVLI
jgi:hypothetical protein